MEGDSDERRQDLLKAVGRFLDDTTTQPEEISILRRYLDERPDISPVTDILALDELEERLNLSDQIQNQIRQSSPELVEWRFNAIQLSSLLIAPLHELRLQSRILSFPDAPALLKRLEGLVGHFFQSLSHTERASSLNLPPTSSGNSNRKRKSLSNRDDDDEDYNPAAPRIRNGKIERSATERDKCRRRDGNACVFTGSANPKSCHIIPFAFNSSQENLERSRNLIKSAYMFLGSARQTELSFILANVIGGSDYDWNMICLNRQIHTWWAKGLLALKCLGISPAGEPGFANVSVQFSWMPRNYQENHNPGREVIPLLNGRQMVGELKEYDPLATDPTKPGNRVVFANRVSGRKLLSGHRVNICTTPRKAQLMKKMIDFQWAMVAMNALAGAAGSPDLTGPRDDLGEGPSITNWLNATEFLPLSQPGSPVATPSTPKSKPFQSGGEDRLPWEDVLRERNPTFEMDDPSRDEIPALTLVPGGV